MGLVTCSFGGVVLNDSKFRRGGAWWTFHPIGHAGVSTLVKSEYFFQTRSSSLQNPEKEAEGDVQRIGLAIYRFGKEAAEGNID
jgi:hypothetical protein